MLLVFILGSLNWYVILAGPCDPGVTIYAPYPSTLAFVQATVLTYIIDGTFIVEWKGSPDICNDPGSRSKCVVHAAEAYNGQVISNILLQLVLLGDILLL